MTIISFNFFLVYARQLFFWTTFWTSFWTKSTLYYICVYLFKNHRNVLVSWVCWCLFIFAC